MPPEMHEQDRTTMVALISSPHANGRMPALRHADEYLLPAAALAHLVVEARGSWRMRRGEVSWEQAGPDGIWRPVEPLMIGEVLWYRTDPGWRLWAPGDESDGGTPVNQAEQTTVNGVGTEGGQQVSSIPRQRVTARAALAIVPSARRPA